MHLGHTGWVVIGPVVPEGPPRVHRMSHFQDSCIYQWPQLCLLHFSLSIGQT